METVTQSTLPKNLMVAAARLIKDEEPGRYANDKVAVQPGHIVATDRKAVIAFPHKSELDQCGLYDADVIWNSRAPKRALELSKAEDGTFPDWQSVIPERESNPMVTFSIKLLKNLMESMERADCTLISFQSSKWARENGREASSAWRVEGNEHGKPVCFGAIMPCRLERG